MSKSAPASAPALADFEGGFERRLGDAVNGGQSTYHGSLVVTLIDRSQAAAVLPPSLRLADPTDFGVVSHPVIYLLGQQRDLRALIAGTAVPVPDPPYTELIVLVPFVVHAPNGDRWHSFAMRMYLDQPGPVRVGNDVYAYAKRLANFDSGYASTAVFAGSDEMFEAAVLRSGPWLDAAAAATTLPGFAWMQEILEMPIVGHDARGEICSYFEWDYAEAEAARASSTHRFIKPFRPEMSGWPSSPLLNALDGAFKVRGIRWRLSYEPSLPSPTPACRFVGVKP